MKNFTMKKTFILLIIFTLLFAGLVGCTSTPTTTPPADPNQGESQYPLTITDYTGKDITIPAEPKRIITFFPSNTEILFELGLQDQVIAVTVNDDYPLNVLEKTEYIFTDGLNPNIEQALNLNPDLVIFGAHSDELINSYAKLNIPVVKYNPQSLDEVYQTIDDIGLITNTKKEAVELVASMKEKLDSIESMIANLNEDSKKSVWVEISSDLWTCGTETFMNELIEKAGGVNIVDIPGWVQYSEEKVLEKNPQVIFTTYGYFDTDAVKNVLTREGWNGVDAVKENQVYDVDSNLVNRPGPRIVDAIELLAKLLYPDLFENE